MDRKVFSGNLSQCFPLLIPCHVMKDNIVIEVDNTKGIGSTLYSFLLSPFFLAKGTQTSTHREGINARVR
jgi:hypothetical protein